MVTATFAMAKYGYVLSIWSGKESENEFSDGIVSHSEKPYRN